MKFVLSIVLNAIALWLVVLLLPGLDVTSYESGDPTVALIVTYLLLALVWGLVNSIIGKVVRVVSLPLGLQNRPQRVVIVLADGRRGPDNRDMGVFLPLDGQQGDLVCQPLANLVRVGADKAVDHLGMLPQKMFQRQNGIAARRQPPAIRHIKLQLVERLVG